MTPMAPLWTTRVGLAEMGGLGEQTIRVADELDSAGNTVKAVTKGFAIGAAGLTVISLLGAYLSEVNEALMAAEKRSSPVLILWTPRYFSACSSALPSPRYSRPC